MEKKLLYIFFGIMFFTILEHSNMYIKNINLITICIKIFVLVCFTNVLEFICTKKYLKLPIYLFRIFQLLSQDLRAKQLWNPPNAGIS